MRSTPPISAASYADREDMSTLIRLTPANPTHAIGV
jgi:hypothetical protein